MKVNKRFNNKTANNIRVNKKSSWISQKLIIALFGMAICMGVNASSVSALAEQSSNSTEVPVNSAVPSVSPASETDVPAESTIIPTTTVIPSLVPSTVPVVTPTAQVVMPTAPAVTSTVPTASPTTPAIVNSDKLNKTSLKLETAQVYVLKLLNEKGSVTWSSSNEDVVTVNKHGKVKAIAAGTAKVYAECGKVRYQCSVKVNNNGLDYPLYVMEKGEVLRLHFTGNNAKLTWKSSNKSVAKVNNGKVTALKKGYAVISAKAGNKSYECSVVVSSATKSVIYLTFDDGPSLTSTPKILDILKKNKVHATFFTIAYDKQGEKLVKREAAEGHTVAIHGASHDYGKIYTSKEAYLKNITDQQKRIKKTIGKNVWITRFPGGSSNLVSRHYSRGIMKTLVKEVDKAGFAYFDWNVSSGDAGGPISSDQVYSNVTRTLKKNRENVVLMHDFSNNNKTIGALDRVIKYGKSHGYTFKAITGSTLEVHHNVQN